MSGRETVSFTAAAGANRIVAFQEPKTQMFPPVIPDPPPVILDISNRESSVFILVFIFHKERKPQDPGCPIKPGMTAGVILAFSFCHPFAVPPPSVILANARIQRRFLYKQTKPPRPWMPRSEPEMTGKGQEMPECLHPAVAGTPPLA